MLDIDIQNWPEKIRQRYENYLKTSFFFKEPLLRASFQEALRKEGSLLKGPFPGTPPQGSRKGMHASQAGRRVFPRRSRELCCPR